MSESGNDKQQEERGGAVVRETVREADEHYGMLPGSKPIRLEDTADQVGGARWVGPARSPDSSFLPAEAKPPQGTGPDPASVNGLDPSAAVAGRQAALLITPPLLLVAHWEFFVWRVDAGAAALICPLSKAGGR